MAAAVCVVGAVASGCGDAADSEVGEAQAIEASLTADLLDQLPSHEAFAQVFAVRSSGSVEEVGPAATVKLDAPFVVYGDLDRDAVTYEVRLTQGNARIASTTFRDPAQVSVIGKESTVEADVILNGIRDGVWCEACSLGMVRYFVTAPVAAEFCGVPKSYHNSIRFYSRGVAAGIQAWADTLRASNDVDHSAYASVAAELDGAYRDYEVRVTDVVDPVTVRTAQRELDLAFTDMFVDAGFSRYTLARAAQIVAELMLGNVDGIDGRAVAELIFESERVRAQIITDFVTERMVAAGVPQMRLAGLNSELISSLETIPAHGHVANLVAERSWLAYQMGIIAAFAEAHDEVSVGQLLLELGELDEPAKGAVNAIALEQSRSQTRAAPIAAALDDYRRTVDRASFHASLSSMGVPKNDVSALADAIFFVTIPAHGVPPLLVEL